MSDEGFDSRKAALRSKEKNDKDRVNNNLAPRTEGPFPVVKVDDHTVTVLRWMGLKERILDRVVKSPPLRRNLEGTTPSLADPRDDKNFSSLGMTPKPRENTVGQAVAPNYARTGIDGCGNHMCCQP